MGEPRIERLERLMEDIIRRLERVESILKEAIHDPLVSAALELAITYSQPASKAVKIAKAVLNMERRLEGNDPISRAIIEALAVKEGPLTVSQLTEEVRQLRGTASRRIVRERVKELQEAGVVNVRRVGRKLLVELVKFFEGEDN